MSRTKREREKELQKLLLLYPPNGKIIELEVIASKSHIVVPPSDSDILEFANSHGFASRGSPRKL